MRNLLTVASRLSLGISFALLPLAACDGGPGAPKDPPVLTITSPARSMVRGSAGQLSVTGTAIPGAHGSQIASVTVNGTAAAVAADGSFTAMISVPQGATLIETTATDADGTTATDTRAVQAGELRPVGTMVNSAIAAAISTSAFAKLSAAAGPIIKGLNLAAMLKPLQPIFSVGDSLANLKVTVDNLQFSDIHISLVPVQGGLMFSAEIDGLNVPGHIDFAGTLVPDGSTTIKVTADKITIAGTLDVAPNGMSGFKATLANPDVHITNADLSASGIPGAILDLLDINAVLSTVASKAAELAMGPLFNLALGALGGPQTLSVLGKKLDMQVAPSAVQFTADGGLVEMNMKAMLEGSESSPGFIFTDTGAPSMDPSFGFQLGIADNLANELLAELHALGMLNLSMPQNAGVFDTAQIEMTMPPMITADANDGAMRLVLGDMFATFTSHGTPVGKAAINARIDVQIAPVANGGSVALQLGNPEIRANVLDDVPNTTGLGDKDLAAATSAVLGAQIDALSKLLVSIPVPAIAGLQFHDLSIGGSDGYVMVSGQIE